MSNKINKEKTGLVIKTTVRIPKEQYEWLKIESDKTRDVGNYKSMNDFVSEGIELLRRQER